MNLLLVFLKGTVNLWLFFDILKEAANLLFLFFRAHLANHDELISKSFQGSQGRAYLFNSVVNIGCGQAEERVLLTGLHAVADIYCDCCKTVLGWKYEQAYESSQKYKEGKFIIELAHMIKENGWENESWDFFYLKSQDNILPVKNLYT